MGGVLGREDTYRGGEGGVGGGDGEGVEGGGGEVGGVLGGTEAGVVLRGWGWDARGDVGREVRVGV